MKVMIVEDSPTIRRLIKNSLEFIGYDDVVEAGDGLRALAALKEAVVDVIITDWNMPNMNGLDFIRNLRKNKKYQSIPVLMITGRNIKEDVVNALNAGATNYIVKPFTPQTLHQKMEEMLSTEEI